MVSKKPSYDLSSELSKKKTLSSSSIFSFLTPSRGKMCTVLFPRTASVPKIYSCIEPLPFSRSLGCLLLSDLPQDWVSKTQNQGIVGTA